MPFQVFISSVQSEFAEERAAIRDYIKGDPVLGRHFDVFIFEDAPAQDRPPDGVYLDELSRSDIYVGLFGEKYGSVDEEGVSPTEREFDFAVERRKERLIYIKTGSDAERDPKMQALVDKAQRQVVRRTFSGITTLASRLNESLLHVLEKRQIISVLPIELRDSGLKIRDLDSKLIKSFIRQASAAGRVGFKENATPAEALKNLGLADKSGVKNAAVILFTPTPAQRFPGARINCIHFQGTEPVKPAQSQKVFEAGLFDQIESAVDFVLTRLARAMPARDKETTPEAPHELPAAAVREAIVNAVAHRDYLSPSPVRVSLLSDRLEVRNPGELPPGLTPEQLKLDHNSIPKNPLLIDILFRAEFMNRSGTGTTDMVRFCTDAGLPEPDFFQDGDQWVVRFWRDWMNEARLAELGLNRRQIAGLIAAKMRRRLSTSEYMDATGASRPTAKRDIEELVEIGLLAPAGSGRGAHYIFK